MFAMRSVICFSVLVLSLAVLSSGQMFGGMIKQASDMFNKGTGAVADAAQKAQDMVMQGMSVPLAAFREYLPGGPFEQALDAFEEVLGSGGEISQKAIDTFKQGSEKAAQMGEGAGAQSDAMFTQAINLMKQMQEQGASPEQYKEVLNKIKSQGK